MSNRQTSFCNLWILFLQRLDYCDAHPETDVEIFTYNNDYYFIRVFGPCATIDSKDKPLYLFPGEGLTISQQPVDFVYCDLATTPQATFEVVTQYLDPSKIVYQ